jgi:hypothetical protein
MRHATDGDFEISEFLSSGCGNTGSREGRIIMMARNEQLLNRCHLSRTVGSAVCLCAAHQPKCPRRELSIHHVSTKAAAVTARMDAGTRIFPTPYKCRAFFPSTTSLSSPLAASWLRDSLRPLAFLKLTGSQSSFSSQPALFHCTMPAPRKTRVSHPGLEESPFSAIFYKSPPNSTGSDLRRWEKSGVCMLPKIPPIASAE